MFQADRIWLIGLAMRIITASYPHDIRSGDGETLCSDIYAYIGVKHMHYVEYEEIAAP